DEEPEIEVEFILPDDEADDEADEEQSIVAEEVVAEEKVEEEVETEPADVEEPVAEEQEVEPVAEEETEEESAEVETVVAPEQTHVEQTHVEQTHVEESHVEESHVEQTHVEQTHVEELAEDDEVEDEPFGGLPMIEALPIERPVVEASSGGELSLFGDEERVERKSRKARRNIIRSLYEEESPATIAEEPSVEESNAEVSAEVVEQVEEVAQQVVEPQVEQPQVAVAEPLESESVELPSEESPRVLGEVLGGDVQVLGDAMAAQPSISDSLPLTSICEAIGVADRYMLARELFDGDTKACEEALKALDAIDNFDDCMVHIVENYSWLPTSNGAKLVVDLLQRKFQ
ncbi:MAG: hypothetical protein J6R09_05240, partial [Alistipes sp.]|nr:hypothetical protein [Alistipes sp.]